MANDSIIKKWQLRRELEHAVNETVSHLERNPEANANLTLQANLSRALQINAFQTGQNYDSINRKISVDPNSSLYPIYILTRSYAPFKWFGPGNEWHGDNRWHTLDRGASYRSLVSIMHDTETLQTNAFGGHSRSYNKDFSKDAISPTYLDNKSEGSNIDVHSSGSNKAVFGTPSIDQFTKLRVTTSGNINANHILNIKGTISGDDFPNQESVVYDSKGNALWLGNFETPGSQEWGPVRRLWGEDEEDVNININLQINVNSDGIFQSVIQGNNTISIEDWNIQFE